MVRAQAEWLMEFHKTAAPKHHGRPVATSGLDHIAVTHNYRGL